MASAAGAVEVVDPEPFPPPQIRHATVRDCQVMDDSQQVRWVRCLVPLEPSPHGAAAYSFVRSLRECIYGVVRHAVTLHYTNGFYRYRVDQQVAIKCMSKTVIREQRGQVSEDPIQELSALQLLSRPGHEHVQRMVDCLQDADHIYAVCPFYAGGELFSYVQAQGGGMEETKARGLFRQIVSGLHYMHSLRLSNRDVSLENILLVYADRPDACVIIDMGMCIRVPALPQHQSQRRVLIRSQGQVGKLTYMAPEVFASQDFDGYAIDVWGVGVVLFILLTGVPPVELPCPATDPRFRLIAAGRLGDLLDVWNMGHISPQARDLLTGLLRAQPQDRPSLEAVLQHPWLQAQP